MIADAVKGFMEGVVNPVLDKIAPDAKDRLEATQLIEKQTHALVMAQLVSQAEINKTEAQSTDRFVAGWRPFIGWVCGGTLAYIWVVRDLIAWVIVLVGSSLPAPPLVMGEQVLELTLGMLGLAGLRTYEKVKGATK